MAKSRKNIAWETVATQFKVARARADKARRIRAQLAEFRKIGKASAMVVAGVLMAFTYCLLMNRI